VLGRGHVTILPACGACRPAGAHAMPNNMKCGPGLLLAHQDLPHFPMNVDQVNKPIRTNANIDSSAKAILNQLSDWVAEHPDETLVMALDAEWNTTTNSSGRVIGSDARVSTMQIAYDFGGGATAVIYQVKHLTRLPASLRDLLCAPKVRFTGRMVTGDRNKVRRTFPDSDLNECKVLELGLFCAQRDPANVPKGSVSLQKLCATGWVIT
jgi:hypothetical protein